MKKSNGNGTFPGLWKLAWKKCRQIFGESAVSLQAKRARRLAPLQELEDRCLLSVTPVGTEFRVNTRTQGPQQTVQPTPRAVAMNPTTGDYVAVWSSQGQNGGGSWDVYMQRYNAAGVAQGGETLVDTAVNGVNQQYANVAMNASGNFVVTWSSQQGGRWNIYAQQYNAAGVAQGSALLVDTPTSNDQEYSSVAMNASGHFVVTWSGQQSGHWQIYANDFDQNGVSLSGPFQVTNAANDQRFSDVAMSAAGNFVITWSGHQAAHWNVYAERYGSNDQPVAPAFQVNTNTTHDQMNAAVALDAGGNFTITWSGHQNGHWNIYAQSYLVGGAANGSNFQVNLTTGQDQQYSSIAFAGSGDPIITWSSNNQDVHRQDGNGWGVYVQEFTPTGTPLGIERLVNTYTHDNQFYSSIAGAANGDLAIVWTSNNQDGSATGVYGQQFSTVVSFPGIMVMPTSGLVTTTGGSVNFMVVLTSQPTSNVSVTLTSSNPLAGHVGQPSVDFTAADWDLAKTVTVTSPNNPGFVGDVAFTIQVGPAVSADLSYQGRSGSDVVMTLHVAPGVPATTPVLPPAPPLLIIPVILAPGSQAPSTSAAAGNGGSGGKSGLALPSAATTVLHVSALTPNVSGGNDTADNGMTTLMAQAAVAANRTIQVFAPIPKSIWQPAQDPGAPSEDASFHFSVSRTSLAPSAPAQLQLAQANDVLDVLNDDGERIPWTEPSPETTVLVGIGIIASSGYVLMNPRIGLWLLGLMAARPLWKQFDPLDVLYAWEDDGRGRASDNDEEETLMSLVD